MIIVFGNIAQDITYSVPRLLTEDEYLPADTVRFAPGGKGANQALACARGGAKTAFVSCIGEDSVGEDLIAKLRRQGVMTSGVARTNQAPTSMVSVLLLPNGESSGVGALAAGELIAADQVPDEILTPDNILLLQMVVPWVENEALINRAHDLRCPIIVNLAPALKMPMSMLQKIDYLIVNKIEAQAIAESVGFDKNRDDFKEMAKMLADAANLTCVVTLGPEGALLVTAEGQGWSVPAYDVPKVVDTTGAGDCFCGIFAASLHNGLSLPEALRRGTVAGSLSTQVAGAQAGYPFYDDIEEALENYPDATAIYQ